MDQPHHIPVPKVISSAGPNAAYLKPGESAVSLKHSICTLIVLTNGRETFVTHQVFPDHHLIGEFRKLGAAMGGPLTAKLYQNNESSTDYSELLEEALGPDLVLERHQGRDSYFVTADGMVERLGKEGDAAYQRCEQRYAAGQTFLSIYEHETIKAVERVPLYFGLSAAESSNLYYTDIPEIFNAPHHPFTIRTGPAIDHIPDAKEWNDIHHEEPDPQVQTNKELEGRITDNLKQKRL